MHCANLRPEDSKFFSLGNSRIEKAKKDSALRRFGRDLTELAAKGGFAAFDRSAGGDVENHPNPAAKPEEQSDFGERSGRGKDRDLEVKLKR
jgi:hypothetical protein